MFAIFQWARAICGAERYIKLPKQGTNPRGVEITNEALELLTKDPDSMRIEINWDRRDVKYDVYDRWIELWRE